MNIVRAEESDELLFIPPGRGTSMIWTGEQSLMWPAFSNSWFIGTQSLDLATGVRTLNNLQESPQ